MDSRQVVKEDASDDRMRCVGRRCPGWCLVAWRHACSRAVRRPSWTHAAHAEASNDGAEASNDGVPCRLNDCRLSGVRVVHRLTGLSPGGHMCGQAVTCHHMAGCDTEDTQGASISTPSPGAAAGLRFHGHGLRAHTQCPLAMSSWILSCTQLALSTLLASNGLGESDLRGCYVRKVQEKNVPHSLLS